MSRAKSAERPILVGPIESPKRFGDYVEAAHWLVGELSSEHQVARLFVPKVSGELIDIDNPKARFLDVKEVGKSYQQLRLEGDGVTGTVDRYCRGVVFGGVTVAEVNGGLLDIQVNVEGYPGKLLDRGSAWVRVGHTMNPLFHATINTDHGIEDPLELAAKLSGAEARAVRFIEEGILESKVIEEIARGDAG